MSYQPPLGPSGYRYEVAFQAAQSSGEYPMYFRVVPEVSEVPHAEAEELFQRFVDLVDGSPDFTLLSASRTHQYYQQVTASPAP